MMLLDQLQAGQLQPDQLQDILDQLLLLRYEITLVLGSLLVLAGGLLFKKPIVPKVLFAGTLLAALFGVMIRGEEVIILSGFLALDGLGDLFRLAFAGLSLWVVFFPGVTERKSEFYFILLSVITGSVFMLSANHLLIIYLAVELTSFAAYLITNFNFQKRSFEAGLKYLLFGGVSSAVALYGASLVYGFTGTLVLSEMDFNVIVGQELLNLGLVAFIGGLFFKISLVPFHIWTPSAYEEAPTESLPILASLPKVGALVLLHRVFLQVDIFTVNWLFVVVSVFGMVTIALGTLGAMRQNNSKRLIAYGAIAHSGFLLAALLVPGESGGNAFVWYSLVYMVMNLAVFYLLALFEEQGVKGVSDFSGQGKEQSYLGGLLVLVLIALIGLPPTAGFTAKFYIFSTLWGWYENIGDPLILTYLGVGLISVVFSLFFYLKIPYYYFLKESENPTMVNIQFSQRLLATIFAGVLLWIFFSPDLLNNIAENIKFIAW